MLSVARTRPQPFQGDLAPQGDVGSRMPGACQLCCNGGGNPHPKKNPDSRLLEARAFHGPTGDGLSSQSDLFNGLIQLAAVAPAICAEPATVGAGPCRRQPLCTVLAEFGSSLWSAKATAVQDGCCEN